MTPYEFIQTWGPRGSRDGENERQGAQPYFLDLCELLDVPKPGNISAERGADSGYIFEKQTLALGQQRGFADVFYKGRFAWENKAPGKNLDGALRQLLGYSLALDNPPLLVVCDRHTIRIHTQFNGHPSVTHTLPIEQLTDPARRELLRRLWLDPNSFRPQQTNRDITEQAAKSFATLADGLRKRGPQPKADDPAATQAAAQYAEQIAHFLTQTLFCFFAEDVGLLPGRMFEQIVSNRHFTSKQLTETLQKLMDTMRDGGVFGADVLPWFNGGLFRKVNVPKLEITDITELRNAARLNWTAIDVSIFGTLFERGLDPAKRSQLGAHYTDPATIERIIEPVVRRPLLQNWERSAHNIRGLLAKSTKINDKSHKLAQAAYITYLQSLADFKILDPACGSGNFLYLGLKALKDLEHQVITEAESMGLQRPVDLATGPANMLGIELNEYAAELARVTVWIGELQWRMEHGYPFKDNPVLEPLDFIEHRDALLVRHPVRPEPNSSRPEPHPVRPELVEGQKFTYTEARWPKVSVVIGNPPFLGDKKMRGELGDEYVTALRKTYEGRVPGGADLVCYWFEQARHAIETQGLGAAGLVATQSIRAGANRKVLTRICESTRIFEAWSDETWVNEGAAVRVSLVAFGWGQCCFLNGQSVNSITADLGDSASGDLTVANNLSENAGVAFQGPVKVGAFDISGSLARQWLALPTVGGATCASVLKPWANGQDLTRRPSDTWIIDFGAAMSESEAMLFEQPYGYVTKAVKPQRLAQNDAGRKKNWWLHGRTGDDMRAALQNLPRYIATVRVAKHRFFVQLPVQIWPDSRLYAIARADDCTFGILSSHIHEVWSLAQASMHGVGNDPTYNAKSCFETFPFPAGLTPLDTAHQRTESIEGGALIPQGLQGTVFKTNVPKVQAEYAQSAIKSGVSQLTLKEAASAIARAAQRLHSLRENWLNPPEWTQRLPEVTPLGMDASPYPERILPRNNLSEQDLKELTKRTLTNLYNQKQAGQVQWLQSAHEQLDAHVATAYGWSDYSPAMPDEEILKRLLALNLERAG